MKILGKYEKFFSFVFMPQKISLNRQNQEHSRNVGRVIFSGKCKKLMHGKFFYYSGLRLDFLRKHKKFFKGLKEFG